MCVGHTSCLEIESAREARCQLRIKQDGLVTVGIRSLQTYLFQYCGDPTWIQHGLNNIKGGGQVEMNPTHACIGNYDI